MNIKVTKLTDSRETQLACSYTANKAVKPSLRKLYLSRHSPCYTQIFRIELRDIPLEVRDHLVRHHVGVIVQCWQTHRDDRSGENADEVTYNTLTSGYILLDAVALINIAGQRLCYKAHRKTREVMLEIKEQVKAVDPDLYDCLLPACANRGMQCFEFSGCGMCENIWDKYDEGVMKGQQNLFLREA